MEDTTDWPISSTLSYDLFKDMKPAHPPIDVPGCTPSQKMDNLFRVVIIIPKAEIDRREKEWKRAKRRRKAPRP